MEAVSASVAAAVASVAAGNMTLADLNPCITDGLFFDPENANVWQLMFLTAVYGYVLFMASNFISDGSELLLLVPSISGIVGTVVLPVLGAVPDGMMVLFSCLGPNAQEQVNVGVGALAGSTIMLLTLPWFLAILGGRVDLDENGECQYTKKPKLSAQPPYGSGVVVSGNTKRNAKIMMLTSMFYLIIQVPALMYHGPSSGAAAFENGYALIGAVVCFIGLVCYLAIQVRAANQSSTTSPSVLDDKIFAKRLEQLQNGQMDIRGLMCEVVKKSPRTIAPNEGTMDQHLTVSTVDPELKSLLKYFFGIYDTDKSNSIDYYEWGYVLKDLGLQPVDYAEHFKEDDKPLMLEDFCERVEMICRTDKSFHGPTNEQTPESEETPDEEEDMPEDLADLTPGQQQSRIKFRAGWMMAMGTFMVLVFSDPAVDVLNEIGIRTGIDAFYISFILAPLASNASELVAAYSYACKKTSKTIDVSLSTLQGAACMNNTYCLFIFLTMIYLQQLQWAFTAETVAIVVVQLAMGVLSFKKVHTMSTAYMIISMYPASLALVWTMENILGFD